YTQAKIQQLHHLMEEILEIADDSTNDYMEVVAANGKTKIIQNREVISRSRLRINTRIALITKLAPILKGNKEEKEETIRELPPPPDWWINAGEKITEMPKEKEAAAQKSVTKKSAEKTS